MNVENAVDYLREQGVNVVQTLEEYFISVDGRLVMITEKEITNHAKKIRNAPNNVRHNGKKISKRTKSSI